ncbi:Caspase domain-containing protein [Nannocystis exedens]|uniref:Caspase domain-containing protein n=1 Tax=Nannocystis exedens TaxID=54 RepID=A0A1I2ABF3_9BACT|nr:caspase family protein [Nannocystis exedens]PCC69740.1 Caspase domain protein [Nannocystis exedens]SFE41119.1 Caspase domain-containing protein [Nannocystis exedens]
MTRGLDQRQGDALTRPFALGRARVLAVGIDDYDRDCGFEPLTTGRNDAFGFADCFRDLPQLGADPGAVKALVSRRGPMPSRGEIVKALRELARSSAADERLVFYFSGHGHRLAGDADSYLVPQDAFADDDPTCLVSFSMIAEILRSAPAEQKLAILDVRLGGSSRARAPVSREAFDASLQSIRGVTVLASLAEDVPSTTRSPNPQHSLFTALLLPALRGEEPGALDERRLTVSSLYGFLSAQTERWGRSRGSTQRPVLHGSSRATMVLADFSGPVLSADGLAIDGRLFDAVELSVGSRQVAVKDILTELSRTHYSQSYLEARANAALGGYLQEELGRTVSRLRARFKWASSAVSVEGCGLAFPDGHYSVSYEATEKTRGVLVEHLSLQPAWLDAPGLVFDLLECLNLHPDRITFALREGCAPVRCVPQLEARGWAITSELPHRVEAAHGDCSLILEKQALTLVDLPLREMFTETPNPEAVRKAAAALAVFSGG